MQRIHPNRLPFIRGPPADAPCAVIHINRTTQGDLA
jgi:hypothetical protein